jgi:transcriptional regulator with XRE-family HTH domain
VSKEQASQLREEVLRQIEARRWSGRELARQAGLSPSGLADKLAGKRPFDLADLAAIAPVLGFRDWELLRKARGE